MLSEFRPIVNKPTAEWPDIKLLRSERPEHKRLSTG